MNKKFTAWMTSVCFQRPPKHSLDLAESAWNEQQKEIDLLRSEVESLKRGSTEAIEIIHNAVARADVAEEESKLLLEALEKIKTRAETGWECSEGSASEQFDDLSEIAKQAIKSSIVPAG